jgi:L-gulonolactone oxidase
MQVTTLSLPFELLLNRSFPLLSRVIETEIEYQLKQAATMSLLTNWNDEIRFEVADDHFERPVQVRDVQAIVRRAFDQHQRVTVIGAMHSTTECIVGTGIVISMKNMARVLSVDREGLTVTVEGGVTLRQLCAYLRELGL